MKFTEQEGSKRLLKNLKNFLLLLRRQPLTLLARPRRSLDNGVEMKFAFRQIVTILFGTSDRVVVLHQGLEIVRFFLITYSKISSLNKSASELCLPHKALKSFAPSALWLLHFRLISKLNYFGTLVHFIGSKVTWSISNVLDLIFYHVRYIAGGAQVF